MEDAENHNFMTSIAIINGQIVTRDQVLAEGNQVQILQLFTGG
jgi:sulfur carrier protein ThiS